MVVHISLSRSKDKKNKKNKGAGGPVHSDLSWEDEIEFGSGSGYQRFFWIC